MPIDIQIPDPLADQLQDAARLLGTTAQQYVVAAVTKSVASGQTKHEPPAENPLIGLLADEPDLADFVAKNAYEMRDTFPLRTPRG